MKCQTAGCKHNTLKGGWKFCSDCLRMRAQKEMQKHEQMLAKLEHAVIPTKKHTVPGSFATDADLTKAKKEVAHVQSLLEQAVDIMLGYRDRLELLERETADIKDELNRLNSGVIKNIGPE